MVRLSNRLNRFAFTLIELIFAIVIIGISVISLPMMTQVTSQGVENNVLQEAIFAASAELMGASAAYWDFNSMQDVTFSNMSRVVDIGGACVDDNTNARDRLRPGHIPQPYHRQCLNNPLTTPANTSSNLFPNLDNAEQTRSIFVDDSGATAVESAEGYKEIYTSTLSVTQNGDIKTLEVSVSDTDGNLITVLSMQSANIGEIDYYKRRF